MYRLATLHVRVGANHRKIQAGLRRVATLLKPDRRDRSTPGYEPRGRFGPSILRAWPEQMKGSKSRMQGKKLLGQSAERVYVGIDVCKDRLDVYSIPLAAN